MTLAEFEAMAQQRLTRAERIVLAKRWLAEEQSEPPLVPEDDPIYNFGKNPASGGDLEGTSELDKYLYDRSRL